MTSEGSPRTRFRRAIERRALWLAEDAMREMGVVTLGEAFQLVELYRDVGSPKYEKAAWTYLRDSGRYDCRSVSGPKAIA